MKRFFFLHIFLGYSFLCFAQTSIGIDLFRLGAKTVDIGVTHTLKKKNCFLTARAGYTFDREVPKRYGISNLQKSNVSGSFIAGGLGFDLPRAQDPSLYMGLEVMADWGSREDLLLFKGIYGEQILRMNQNFTTVGMNLYLGKSSQLWKNLYLEAIGRVNFVQCDPGQLDRVVSPSIGVDWNGNDGSFAINLNIVCKLSYQFGVQLDNK